MTVFLSYSGGRRGRGRSGPGRIPWNVRGRGGRRGRGARTNRSVPSALSNSNSWVRGRDNSKALPTQSSSSPESGDGERVHIRPTIGPSDRKTTPKTGVLIDSTSREEDIQSNELDIRVKSSLAQSAGNASHIQFSRDEEKAFACGGTIVTSLKRNAHSQHFGDQPTRNDAQGHSLDVACDAPRPFPPTAPNSTNVDKGNETGHDIMERRGRNKLVKVVTLKKTSNNESFKSKDGKEISNRSIANESGGLTVASYSGASIEASTDDGTKSQAAMRKLGKNKLVLNRDSGSSFVDATRGLEIKRGGTQPGNKPNVSLKVGDSQVSSGVGPASLKRKGTNKLVPNMSTVGQLSNMRPKKRNTLSAPYGAKRIKLMVTTEKDDTEGHKHDHDDQVVDGTTTSPKPANLASKSTTHGKLTDFVYRETNRVRHSGGHKRWTKNSEGKAVGSDQSINHGSIRNMGLVRVHTETSSTPICLTFLKGVACTDKYCVKRHDVPKEFTMPVCSFFQRHGQCLREDCQFRHVKVNPRATLCPSFAMLGFCPSTNCVMRHEKISYNSNKGDQNRKKF